MQTKDLDLSEVRFRDYEMDGLCYIASTTIEYLSRTKIRTLEELNFIAPTHVQWTYISHLRRACSSSILSAPPTLHRQPPRHQPLQ